MKPIAIVLFLSVLGGSALGQSRSDGSYFDPAYVGPGSVEWITVLDDSSVGTIRVTIPRPTPISTVTLWTKRVFKQANSPPTVFTAQEEFDCDKQQHRSLKSEVVTNGKTFQIVSNYRPWVRNGNPRAQVYETMSPQSVRAIFAVQEWVCK